MATVQQVKWRVVVTLSPGGSVIRLARESYAIPDASTGGRQLLVRGALASISIPIVGADVSDAEVETDDAVVPVKTLAAAGVILSGCPAEVALWKRGTDWTARRILLLGRVKPDGVSRDPYQSKLRLSLSDYSEQLDKPFPPATVELADFPTADSNVVGNTIPAIYGDCVDVPLLQVTPASPTVSTVRFVVACGRVFSQKINCRPDGNTTAQFSIAVQYDYAPSQGVRYAYVQPTIGQLNGASSLVADVKGFTDASGYMIDGLGSVVDHALRNFTKVPIDRFDEERLSRFRPRANRIVVASVFGGGQGDTCIASMKSRYEGNLPVVLSWRGGRIGADYAGWDPFAQPVRSLSLNRELLRRIGSVDLRTEAGGQGPFTSYKVFYGVRAYGRTSNNRPAPRASVLRSVRTGDSRCADAASRYGEVIMPPVQLVDVASAGGANAAIDALVERHSVVRTHLSYLCRTDDVVDLPLLERYDLTDADVGIAAEPFRLETVQHQENDMSVCAFSSYKNSPV